jgi:maltose/moltooligosaccharide transporter
MLALPFTILTNALQGTKKMGTFLGLFNCTICIPQIIAALLGGVLLKYIAGDSQPVMLLIAGIFLVFGAASVFVVKIKKSE